MKKKMKKRAYINLEKKIEKKFNKLFYVLVHALGKNDSFTHKKRRRKKDEINLNLINKIRNTNKTPDHLQEKPSNTNFSHKTIKRETLQNYPEDTIENLSPENSPKSTPEKLRYSINTFNHYNILDNEMNNIENQNELTPKPTTLINTATAAATAVSNNDINNKPKNESPIVLSDTTTTEQTKEENEKNEKIEIDEITTEYHKRNRSSSISDDKSPSTTNTKDKKKKESDKDIILIDNELSSSSNSDDDSKSSTTHSSSSSSSSTVEKKEKISTKSKEKLKPTSKPIFTPPKNPHMTKKENKKFTVKITDKTNKIKRNDNFFLEFKKHLPTIKISSSTDDGKGNIFIFLASIIDARSIASNADFYPNATKSVLFDDKMENPSTFVKPPSKKAYSKDEFDCHRIYNRIK
jgi:hypothetical protein